MLNLTHCLYPLFFCVCARGCSTRRIACTSFLLPSASELIPKLTIARWTSSAVLKHKTTTFSGKPPWSRKEPLSAESGDLTFSQCRNSEHCEDAVATVIFGARLRRTFLRCTRGQRSNTSWKNGVSLPSKRCSSWSILLVILHIEGVLMVVLIQMVT